MSWLNYHHLLYFWSVARLGSVTKASEELHLAQPTISSQIRTLEESLGEKLFVKSGRGLKLTEAGQLVFRYADEIFSLGRELRETLRGRPTGKPAELRVGIAEVLPKLVTFKVLEPALSAGVRLVCTEGTSERLLADLALQTLDLVLADAPVGAGVRVKAFNHLLGESGVGFFAAPRLLTGNRRRFPEILHGAPMLLPSRSTLMGHALDQWFARAGVVPNIVAELEDSALLKVFGEQGAGIFPAPSVVERAVRDIYHVRVVGRTEEVRERVYAISVERRVKHPVVSLIIDQARARLFASG
jgi:LysR family transcriptional activator of nhaA